MDVRAVLQLCRAADAQLERAWLDTIQAKHEEQLVDRAAADELAAIASRLIDALAASRSVIDALEQLAAGTRLGDDGA